MHSAAQLLELALQYHRAGDLFQAERLYRQIPQVEPQYADALHMLGVIAFQAGKYDSAVEYLRQAIQIRPERAEVYNILGNAWRAKGHRAAAIASYREALRLLPSFAEAHYHLGLTLHEEGELAEAILSYRRALQYRPTLAEAHNNLGNIYQAQGNATEAMARYQSALQLQPHNAQAHYNLGLTLEKKGELDAAVASYRQALAAKPDYAEAHNDLGNTLSALGQLDVAVASYRQALAVKPDFAEAHNNLALALKEQGKTEEAIACCRQALRLKPDLVPAYNNLGTALAEQGKLAEALSCYQQALRLQPDLAEAYANLGNALRDQGKIEGAITAFRQAVALQPGRSSFHDVLVLNLNCLPGQDAAALYQEARLWNERHAEPLAKFRQPHANDPDRERRLRIGYVSPDFRNHAVAYVLLPLLANHDPRQVEIFCYAEVARPDDVTARLRRHAGVWRDTVRRTDDEVAAVVRADRIDILVDLALHSDKNRLLVFARKPAPVQVTWLGYPGTTGMPAIDYRLTDPYLDPPGADESCYAEQSIRLPDTFWCYDPLADHVHVNQLPALTNGFITFGCLNNYCKVNDGVLRLWGAVLSAVPRSRLLLLAPPGPARDHVLMALAKCGIDEGRVEFVERQARERYFQLYQRIDLGLDLLPYNGHTTSLDAFWMGVPTLTLVGKTVVGRAGYSQLCNLGLPELAARTPDEYVANVASLATDLPRLQELRAGMRQRMRASPLMDGPRFARNMEQVYRQLWYSFSARAAER
jgi:predicted O-linked N-acetylglucosamine transferase (SPINDLY family)